MRSAANDNAVLQIAHDGVEAMAQLATFMPRLVFLDIGMPRMSGYETERVQGR